MDEEELKRLSSSTFKPAPFQGGEFGNPFGMSSFQPTPQQSPYDTQTNMIVGSSFSPSRSPMGMTPTNFTLGATDSYAPPTAGQGGGSPVVSMPPMDFPIGPTTSQSAVGQNLVTQQPVRTPVLPENLSNPTVSPDRPLYKEIQTPYGTVYASSATPEGGGPSQAMSDRVTEMGSLPAQSARLENIGAQARQSAAVKRMRERGADLAQKRFGAQESFFAQKRAERDALRTAEGAARTAGVRPMDVMRAREAAAGPSTIGGIQREFASYQPAVGPMLPTELYAARAASAFTGALPEGGSRPLPSNRMGASGYALAEQMQNARRATGSGGYSNAGAERRQRNRQMAQSRGMQPEGGLPFQGFPFEQYQENSFRPSSFEDNFFRPMGMF